MTQHAQHSTLLPGKGSVCKDLGDCLILCGCLSVFGDDERVEQHATLDVDGGVHKRVVDVVEVQIEDRSLCRV